MIKAIIAAFFVVLITLPFAFGFQGSNAEADRRHGPDEPVAEPHVIDLIPITGGPGTAVRIRLRQGAKFLPNYTSVSMAARFRSRNIPTARIEMEEIQLSVPTDTACGEYDVHVTTDLGPLIGTSRGSARFTVNRDCKQMPDVRSVTPVHAHPGETVTLIGSNFRAGLQVELSRTEPKPLKTRTILPTGPYGGSTQLSFNMPNNTEKICGYVGIQVKDPSLWPQGQGASIYLACNASHLSVLTFNVKMMVDIGLNAEEEAFRNEMVQIIPRHPVLDDRDVIIFEEMFSDSHRDTIISQLRSRYPYVSRILGSGEDPDEGDTPGWGQDGGVIIVSRWPIENVYGDQELFGDVCNGKTSAGNDCYAKKGVLYVRINKEGQRYHIFGTHLDAGGGAEDQHVRSQQLRILAGFINNQPIQSTEPVIIAGDMNINRFDEQSYAEMLSVLQVEHPRDSRGEYAGETEPQGDYTAPNQCTPRGSFGRAPDERGNYLDYILFSNMYLHPVDVVEEVLESCDGEGRNLSDHFPVRGSFWLTPIPPEIESDPTR